MQWPRDADRLPNGHTLITDSNGNRVFEVNERGDVVWSVNIAFPYEAERIGTGDESTGGPSATQATLQSRTGGLGDRLQIAIKQILPGKYLNGLMYITPPWMGLAELLELVVLLVGGVVWGTTEIVWWYRR
jgi:outer membrane protein assembly factor BamB